MCFSVQKLRLLIPKEHGSALIYSVLPRPPPPDLTNPFKPHSGLSHPQNGRRFFMVSIEKLREAACALIRGGEVVLVKSKGTVENTSDKAYCNYRLCLVQVSFLVLRRLRKLVPFCFFVS